MPRVVPSASATTVNRFTEPSSLKWNGSRGLYRRRRGALVGHPPGFTGANSAGKASAERRAYTAIMSVRDRVARLVEELPKTPQFPTQGATLFIDLERRTSVRAYTPMPIVRALLAGRGANMFYLYRLLDESLHPLHPEVPLIFGSGVLTGIVPSAARGNATSWSPESGVIMDCNAGDYFPSFIRMNGIDHLVLYGRASKWTLLHIHDGRAEFVDATPYVG